jgi:hypothetical protein
VVQIMGMKRYLPLLCALLLSSPSLGGAIPSSQPASAPAKGVLPAPPRPKPAPPEPLPEPAPPRGEKKAEGLVPTPPLIEVGFNPAIAYRYGPSTAMRVALGGTAASFGLLGAYTLIARSAGPSDGLFLAGVALSSLAPSAGLLYKKDFLRPLYLVPLAGVPTFFLYEFASVEGSLASEPELFLLCLGAVAVLDAYAIVSARILFPGDPVPYDRNALSLRPTPLLAPTGRQVLGLSLSLGW